MELDQMHRVIVGMDERVMDVGDSFSVLEWKVEIWLLNNVGEEGEAWFRAFDPQDLYCVDFLLESDALNFTLSWL